MFGGVIVNSCIGQTEILNCNLFPYRKIFIFQYIAGIQAIHNAGTQVEVYTQLGQRCISIVHIPAKF